MGHLYLYDGQTGKLKDQITCGEWIERDIIQVDQLRRLICFSASGREAGKALLPLSISRNFDGSGLTPLSRGAGQKLAFICDHLRKSAARQKYVRTLPTLAAWQRSSRRLRCRRRTR